MTIQTIFQAGNSKVVSIPSSLLRELNLEAGQKVGLNKIDDDSFIVKKIQTAKSQKTPLGKKEFNKWLETVLREDKEILDELANR